MSAIQVVGIDPALRNMGFCKATLDLDTLKITVTDLILVTTEADKKNAKVVRKNSDDLDRAQILHGAIVRECRGASLAFVEVPVGSQSARAMASYGICIGILAACPIPMIQLTPTEVKLAATGSKHAAKQEVIEWAFEQHPAAPWLTTKRGGVRVPTLNNEHLADACAAIYAGIKTDQFHQGVKVMKSMMKLTEPA